MVLAGDGERRAVDLRALQEIEGALETEGFSAFDQNDSASRHAAASRAILVSVRRLPEREQEFFFQLAIFPEDEDIPVSVLERYWGMSHFAPQDLRASL